MSVAAPALLGHKEPDQGTDSWFFMAQGEVARKESMMSVLLTVFPSGSRRGEG